ncbi:Enhancer of polycomb-like protein 1, partial [Ascosphaera atra]
MTEEDEVALRKINAGKPASQQCSEDTFEELMAFFEDTAQLSQPFAAVDHPPVVSYAEMEQSFDQLFETGQETDDADPYVCFRRREVRQVRKTRGRDAQSAEKLRRLRKELEDARELLRRVCERENMRKDQLVLERKVFQQRCEFKEMKRKLGIKEDDDELITYRVVSPTPFARHDSLQPTNALPQPKKKPQEVSTTVAKPAP